MPLSDDAIQKEAERFKDLTRQFRDKVSGDGTPIGGDDRERERIYEILVSINDFIEDKLRRT